MNSFGHNFRVSVFGESHGPLIGAVIDGVPAGIPLAPADFKTALDRRRSGAKGTTPRHEADNPQIISGVYDGHTTGAPLTVLFANENTRPADYGPLVNIPRPGHADYSAFVKSGGWNDPRGGGHFSGRLTLPLVAAGVIAGKVIDTYSRHDGGVPISIHARLAEVGGIPVPETDDRSFNTGLSDEGFISDGLPLPAAAAEKLEAAIREGDSLGGVVECTADHVPAGLGEPFFDSVESLLSHAVFSIPGVRGIEFGDGFAASRMKGSEHNDPFGPDRVSDIPASPSGRSTNAPASPADRVIPLKNGSGGINGGLTNGAPIVFRVAFKPTSSISKGQETLNLDTGEMTVLHVPGRHDACFALRTPVIVEAVTAIVLADLLACR